MLAKLPSDWSASGDFKQLGKLSEPIKRTCEPVGPGFLAHARRTLRGRSWSEDEKLEAERNVKNVEEDTSDLESEAEDEDMLTHDPKDWKALDQYAVLGLSSLRHLATEEQIRKAHRRKVLKHHPDKKAAGGAGDQDGFFKCIQKSFETLLDPVKRRQYDSVDKAASFPAPTKKSKGDFFERWSKFFETEARFSTKQPVPLLGEKDTPKQQVDQFYSFWYHFDSWRSFEWLDEDVPDDSSNRDNKRYIEKKNKAARAKHKKEDIARLQKQVDAAMNEDPRILKFKEDERKAKEQRKWDRDAGAREAAAKAAKEKEEREAAAKAAEEAAKQDRLSSKQKKEEEKTKKKKFKRELRNVVKEVNYFAPAGTDADPGQVADILTDVEKLLAALDVNELGDAVAKSASLDPTDVKNVFGEGLKAKGLSAKYFV